MGNNVDSAWSALHRCVTEVIKEHVPLRSNRVRKAPPWSDNQVKVEVEKKKDLFNRYRRTGRILDWEAYRVQRNHVVNVCRDAKKQYEKRLVREFRYHPKRFYGFVRKMQRSKAGVDKLRDIDGSLTETDYEASTVLLNFFSSVFVNEGDNQLPEFPTRCNSIMSDVVCTQAEVAKRLKALNPEKCPGPDGFHPKFMRECADELAIPLCLIFNRSLQEAKLPDPWKTANVSPLYKKGSRAEAGNYRPVALTSVACKVLESVVKEHLLEHISSNELVSSKQHGFVSGRSCLSNLLEAHENWTKSLDEKKCTDIVFLDYQKAFDTVPHRRLLKKLSAYGVTGATHRWIEDFLTGRRIRVGIRGTFSGWAAVTSGVPQGSVLGPVLFLLYVNDIPELVDSFMNMFADDTKVWRQVSDLNGKMLLQKDLVCGAGHRIGCSSLMWASAV